MFLVTKECVAVGALARFMVLFFIRGTIPTFRPSSQASLFSPGHSFDRGW
jgi:hypothetical protein